MNNGNHIFGFIVTRIDDRMTRQKLVQGVQRRSVSMPVEEQCPELKTVLQKSVYKTSFNRCVQGGVWITFPEREHDRGRRRSPRCCMDKPVCRLYRASVYC